MNDGNTKNTKHMHVAYILFFKLILKQSHLGVSLNFKLMFESNRDRFQAEWCRQM